LNPQPHERFYLVLLKPSHYDDEGYVIQWLRSAIPSNTLACLNGLALDCNQRRVLGENVEIVVSAYDEMNTRIHPKRLIRKLRGKRALVGLVGVQSNQFPRAMDLARPFRHFSQDSGQWPVPSGQRPVVREDVASCLSILQTEH
jgi:hypothetical protein